MKIERSIKVGNANPFRGEDAASFVQSAICQAQRSSADRSSAIQEEARWRRRKSVREYERATFEIGLRRATEMGCITGKDGGQIGIEGHGQDGYRRCAVRQITCDGRRARGSDVRDLR